MFTVDLSIATVAYAGLGVLTIAILWVWSERRDRLFYDSTRRRTTFHCIKCNRVYTSTESHEASRCPACGQENSRLKF
jgi:hypothetical protein